MKKLSILIMLTVLVGISTSFIGCATMMGGLLNLMESPNVQQLDPLELIGPDGAGLEGRLFSSSYESNSASTARATAITNAAKKAKELGFPYFTIIGDSADSTSHTGSYNTAQTHVGFGYGNNDRTTTTYTPHQYSYKRYQYECVFVILQAADEFGDLDNLYTVSKYVK